MPENANKISVESPIGLADSKIVSLLKSGDTLTVTLNTWNNETLEILFFGVIGFRESMADELSDLVRSSEIGQFGEWCLSRSYEGNHFDGELKYQFLDVDYEVAIEIVAKGIQIRIIKEDQQ